jgi:hypothetical protein
LLALLLWAPTAPANVLSLDVRGYEVAQRVFSLFAAPGEVLHVGLEPGDVGNVRVELDGHQIGEAVADHWQLTAPPQPGLYELELRHLENGARSRLNLFVGTYLEEGAEDLDGYRIGLLPEGHSKHPALYPKPRLYFQVTPENIDTRLSEHFTLRQFLCKQESDYPMYVGLSESLLVLLEGLVGAVQEAGYPVETFGIISGYRTPAYNRSIGNVPNSRHVYGDALDFFVDVDGDGNMDDLNGDGARNSADVDLLYAIVEDFKAETNGSQPVGGVGRYYRTSHHGGFIHVDARGFRARW